MSRVVFEAPVPGVGRLLLNDPERLNAMGEEMARDFSLMVTSLAQRPLRALIVTGAGRAFSAGGHLEMLEARKAATLADNRSGMLAFYQAFLAWRELPFPIIAAVNGLAVGAGACLAAACDLRIAGEGSRLAFTFTRLGLHPGLGATWFLPRLVGPGRAAELLLTGRRVDAAEALSIGLVSRVVKDGELSEAAMVLAAQIAENGPEATQQLLNSLRHPATSLSQALQQEATAQAISFGSAEFARGLQAVRERQAPNWK
ncbi:MAG: enoyl-CoA hydratase/isomerase family protein [Candidatus Xenobia bacterium]